MMFVHWSFVQSRFSIVKIKSRIKLEQISFQLHFSTSIQIYSFFSIIKYFTWCCNFFLVRNMYVCNRS